MINLKALAFDHGFKQKDIAEILGVDQPAASRIINGRLNLTQKHIEKLVQKFGEETLKQYDVTPEAFYQARDAQITMIPHTIVEDIKEEIREEVIEELRSEANVESVDTEAVEIKETIILTPEQINQEDVDIKKGIESGTLDVKVKPTQDVLPTHHAKVYTENDEMSPEIEANDPVFVRFLRNKQGFINGRMYFVDLDNGSVVRWVVREDDDYVRLISMKDEEIVPFSRIRSVSEVVAITKRPKTLPKERITMEEAIAHKDNQLDTLLEQQGRLIGIIEGQIKHE